MALAGKVNYEITSPVKIMAGDEDTGVVFHVKSQKCKAARDAIRKIQVEQMAAGVISEAKTIEDMTEAELGDLLDRSEASGPKILAACVDSWDWNGEEFVEGEGEPKFSQDECVRILSHDGGRFIYDQIDEAVMALGKPKAKPKKRA